MYIDRFNRFDWETSEFQTLIRVKYNVANILREIYEVKENKNNFSIIPTF